MRKRSRKKIYIYMNTKETAIKENWNNEKGHWHIPNQ